MIEPRKIRSAFHVLLWSVVAVVVACSAQKSNSDTPGTCPSGATVACNCPSGNVGVAACTPGGLPGACACSAGAGSGGAPAVAQSAGGAPAAGGATSSSSSDQLPCDVSAIVSAHCLLCHTNPPQFTAPMPLITWSNFHAQGVRTPDQPVYQLVATRIQSQTSPMPPPPNAPLSDTEKATMLAWINAGAPAAPAGMGCTPAPPGTTPAAGGAPNVGSAPNGGAPAIGGTGNVASGGAPSTAGAAGAAGAGGYMNATGPSDCQQYYEFTAHGGTGDDDKTPFPVPSNTANDGNQYTCFYFDPPYQAGSEGLWFSPVIVNTAVIHHWLLYAVDQKTHTSGTFASCNAIEAGAYLIAGWAPGASATSLPADVGLQLPQNPNGGFILEVHHFNPNPSVPQTDASGVRFCTAPQNTRAHTAAVHFTGTEGICLNPNSMQSVNGQCVPQTNQGDIHIVNIWPHMHKLGVRQQIVINRAGGTTETLHDAPFDFNSQISYPTDTVIHPGDTLTTTCYYDNTTSAKVPFGEDTQDEMCYGFLTAWPVGALTATATTGSATGSIFQQLRCENNLSILQSCNGLADIPKN